MSAQTPARPVVQALPLRPLRSMRRLRPVRKARPHLALAVVAGCNAMIQLDDPIVNIALPGVRESLGLSALGAAWVINVYLLAFGGLLLLGGRAGDLLGRRKVFLAGVGLFTGAALLRGAASSGEFLVAVRAVQGVGAALAAPSGLALLLGMFAEGTARRRAIAVCTAVGAVSTAGGLLLAGALTSLSSWRWVLLLNVPLGLAVLLLAPFAIEETARARGRFDVAGALVSAAGAAALVYGLAQAAERSWQDPVVMGCVAGGVALLVVFVGIERRAEQPIVMLRLFADRERVCAYVGTLAVPGALIGTYFFLSQYFQKESGWGPLTAAAALSVLPATMAVTAVFAGRLERRLGARQVMVSGAALLFSGNLWLTQLSDTSRYASSVLPALVMLGAGMALCVLPPTVLATSRLRPGEAGAASGVLNSLQSVGGSLGLAVLVTVSAHSGAMSRAFLTGAAFAAVALLAALCLRQDGAARHR